MIEVSGIERIKEGVGSWGSLSNSGIWVGGGAEGAGRGRGGGAGGGELVGSGVSSSREARIAAFADSRSVISESSSLGFGIAVD